MSERGVPPIGAAWQRSSLIRGEWTGSGKTVQPTSPVTGGPIQSVALLSEDEIGALVSGTPWGHPALSADEAEEFGRSLAASIRAHYEELCGAMLCETGFLRRDCEEMVEGAAAYAEQFAGRSGCRSESGVLASSFEFGGVQRGITLHESPYGAVLAILPQNAFLILAVTSLMNAVRGGNEVILRAPTQSPRSSALLARCLADAGGLAARVSVVMASAREIVDAFCESDVPLLVHYLGSSAHGAGVIAKTFEHGKSALIDGDGNCWVWVGSDAPVEQTIETLIAGSTRYNGATCTSINGAIIHPDVYEAVASGLRRRWADLRGGDPAVEGVNVGPLLDGKLAAHCQEMVESSGGTVLRAGLVSGAYMPPVLVEQPDENSRLVREGPFGPVLWIDRGDPDGFSRRWLRNRYPLCAGVLSPSACLGEWMARLPGAARISVNGDPSVEDIFEPWGGYGRSGTGTVASWDRKYVRIVQADAPIALDASRTNDQPGLRAA